MPSAALTPLSGVSGLGSSALCRSKRKSSLGFVSPKQHSCSLSNACTYMHMWVNICIVKERKFKCPPGWGSTHAHWLGLCYLPEAPPQPLLHEPWAVIRCSAKPLFFYQYYSFSCGWEWTRRTLFNNIEPIPACISASVRWRTDSNIKKNYMSHITS